MALSLGVVGQVLHEAAVLAVAAVVLSPRLLVHGILADKSLAIELAVAAAAPVAPVERLSLLQM